MLETNPRLAWGAAAAAPQESHPKEPPRRSGVAPHLDSVAILVDAARSAFKYDWRMRLDDVRPHTHPQMRYDSYRIDKDKLFAAVKILNATPCVDSERASARVIAAYERLRAAVKMQNDYNRQTNYALSDNHLASHDMKLLLELAVFTPKGTVLRHHLERAWLNRMMERDESRDGWQLRIDMEQGLKDSIPGSPEAMLYERGLIELHEKDRAAELKASHPALSVIRK